MSRVIVAEEVAASGLELFRQAGHEVLELVGAPRETLLAELATADALLVRSATKVDRELLAAAPRLSVVGRAGVGVDNVDVPAATARGVLVINAPTANVVSAVEHTFALLFALLRRIPDAAVSMAQGKWEKSRFLGSELAGKTLGIVGLGQVGSRVAARARAFEAKLLGHDPYLPAEKAREMGVPLVSLAELLAGSDIVTLHATAVEKERSFSGGRASRHAAGRHPPQRGAREPRGLRRAPLGLQSESRGRRLDVFDPEPPAADDPLRRLPNVISTPHLGPRPSRPRSGSRSRGAGGPRGAPRRVLLPAVNLPFRGPADPTGRRPGCVGGADRPVPRGPRGRAALGPRWRRGGCPKICCAGGSRGREGPLEEHSPETVNFATHASRARPGPLRRETRHEDTGNYARVSARRDRLPPGRTHAEATLFAGRDPRVVEVDSLPLEFRPDARSSSSATATFPGSSEASGRSWEKAASTSPTSRWPAGAATTRRRSSRWTLRRRPPCSRSSGKRPGSSRSAW